MNNPSVKKIIISALFDIANDETQRGNQIYLVTPLGIISGEQYLLPDENEQDDQKSNSAKMYDLVGKIIKATGQKYVEEYEIEKFLPGNDGFIILKNAKIQSLDNNSVTSFAQLTVFFDQVIAVTIAAINQ